MKRNTWTENEIKWLIDNYPTMGSDFCSHILNYKKSKIFAMAHKLKLKILPNVKKKYNGKLDELCNVNPEKFKNIKTKEVSYFLGLIWSDGYVKKYNRNHDIVLTMNEQDILNIKETLDKIGKWHYNFLKKQRESWKNQIRVSTNNKRIYEILSDYNFTEKSKVSPHELLNNIPKNLHNYFYLGIVDGDGCFYHGKSKNSISRQFSISSTYEQDWSYVESLLVELKVKYTVSRYHKKNGSSSYSTIRVTKKEDIKKIGDFIYKDGKNIGLLRKYKKFLKIIE